MFSHGMEEIVLEGLIVELSNKLYDSVLGGKGFGADLLQKSILQVKANCSKTQT